MKKTEFTLQNLRDKHEIYTYKWESTNEPKAIIQIIHGAGEYANRYDTFAKALVQRGFIVYSHDHRGHGKSVSKDEVFGYFGEKNGFQTLVKDTYEVTKHIKEEYPDKKLIVLGHSMGSFIARYFSVLYSDEIDGLIIVGTGHNSKVELKLGKLVSNIYIKSGRGLKANQMLDCLIFKLFNIGFILEKDVNAWLSRDKESRKEFAQDPYCGIKFTAYAFRDLFEGVEFVTQESNIAKVRKDLPILMISGEKDPVGGKGKMVKKAYELYKKVGIKNITLKLYKDMRHEILNEVGKQSVYKDIIGWINKQI